MSSEPELPVAAAFEVVPYAEAMKKLRTAARGVADQQEGMGVALVAVR